MGKIFGSKNMGTIGTEYLNLGQGMQPSVFSMATEDLKSFGMAEKKLASMNIEDLLRGVAAGDESQSLHSSSEQEDEDKDQDHEIKKSVEDVWREIQANNNNNGKNMSNSELQADESPGYKVCEPQQTLGEMTLEEFLIKSGVVRRGEMGDSNSAPQLQDHKRDREDGGSLLLTQAIDSSRGYNKRLRPSVTKFEDSSGAVIARPASCGGQLLPYGEGSVCVHNQPEDFVDKVAERRQRRMIKNRESAARSRARKQAYTAELEAEVTILKEENEKLKKQQAENASWRKKVVNIVTSLKRSAAEATQPGKLRRTRSV